MPTAVILAAALCIGNVHDGDTVQSCQGERNRVQGIDASELRGSSRCIAQSRQRLASSKNLAWCDDEAGEASGDTLAAFLAAGPVTITRATPIATAGRSRSSAWADAIPAST